MRIYWYWPFIHTGELAVPAAIPREGDELLLHTLHDRVDAPAFEHERFRVDQCLAGLDDVEEGSARWAVARARTYLGRARQRRRTVRRDGFDVCHVVFLNYFTDWYELRALARHARVVFEVHDVVPQQRRLPEAVERAVLGWTYRAPGAIVVRDEHVRDRLQHEFGIEPERMTVIPLHVDPLELPPREAYGSATVMFFGIFRRNKGIEVLLRAIESLRDRPELRFVFAGRGLPDVEATVARAAEADPRIVFEHGYISRDRKAQLYREADLVVLPYSTFSSMSGVLSDAYAYRVPVVVTDVGALGSRVRADASGWVVPPDDAGALAAAIDRALSDLPAWQAASKGAAAAAVSRAPARIGAQYRALYDTL
jgi:glycosyltransferase involved in cell wall biosynthesis